MSLQYEPKVVVEPAAYGELRKIAAPFNPYDESPVLERARRVAKALGLDGGLAPQRNARGDQQPMTKDASEFYAPEFLPSADRVVTEMPDPQAVAILNDSAVNPDLRASIIDAVKRKQRIGSYAAWEQSITPLRAAIDDLIDREGFKFQALHLLLGARGVDANGNPADLANDGDSGAKLAKGGDDGAARRNRALAVLMKLPRDLRQRAIIFKNEIDDLPPLRRRAMLKDQRGQAILQKVAAVHGAAVDEAIQTLLE